MTIQTDKKNNRHIIIRDNIDSLNTCPFKKASPFLSSYNCMICNKHIGVDFNDDYSKQIIYCRIH